MGRRGPQPKPTALKIAEGNPGKRALNKREPKPDKGRPSCPKWLDANAKTCWRWLLPQLEKMGVLTRIDRNALVRYCQLWSRWMACERVIQKDGQTYEVKNPNGETTYVAQRPEVSISNKLAVELRRIEQDFGLTPAARSRIEVEPSKDAPEVGLDFFVKDKRA